MHNSITVSTNRQYPGGLPAPHPCFSYPSI